MVTCQWCGYKDILQSDSFQLDDYGKGFWCELCDGYTYLDKQAKKHSFKLILEDKMAENNKLCKSYITFSKRLSPYRYPGGKSKVIDFLYSQLPKKQYKNLVSPFAGGASFELALLDAGVVDNLYLNDLDIGVFSFWWVVKHMPDELIYRIERREPSHKEFSEAQFLIKNDYRGADVLNAAWASFLVNRLAFSGIVKANPLGGKKGGKEKLLSRWNPQDLIKRIKKVHELSNRIEIFQERAVDIIEEYYWDSDTLIFCDPPFVNKGKQLYHCYYSKKEHVELSQLLDSLYVGCPGADIIVTYDYSQWLEELYVSPNRHIVGRTYSI
ncbi:DNA adenine methylase [Heyndrickxia ginsengihumi]|uniref:DNA adenine methylase n=1 Tax=Heyndrickxia ginsengihumi TaxID=363870 RepID=UPI000470FC6B|nr:DNA adenine methylase [Heyndrickxia ginsengihumi]